MNSLPVTSPAAEPTLGGGALEEALRKQFHEVEQCVREAPGQSVIAAVAAGYMLNYVPVFPLLRAGTRLAINLVPSALVVFGAVKIFSALQRKSVPRPPQPRQPRTDSLLIVP